MHTIWLAPERRRSDNVKEVWKYEIPVEDVFEIWMPSGARVLSVAMQGANPFMWAETSPKARREKRRFRVCGTGHQMPDDGPREFIGTILMQNDTLVFHVFEIKEPTA